MPVATESDGASPQPHQPDENNASESHKKNTEADDMEDKENAEADDMGDKMATVRDTDSTMILIEPETLPISQKQLAAEVQGIYAGLFMVEYKCKEVDNDQHFVISVPIDITMFLEKIPYSKLIRLQQGNMLPYNTVREWLQKLLRVQEDVPEGYKKPSTPEATEDSPTNPEEASARPHVSEKATQVPSFEECLHGFLVALESRAKTDEWPEHEELAALTTAEMGEEGRKKVIDGEYLLAIGREVVDKLVRDLEVVEAKAEKEKAEKEKAQAKPDFNSPYNGKLLLACTCTCVYETPDSSEAQSRSSNANQQTALEETAFMEAEKTFEEVDLNMAEAMAMKVLKRTAEDTGNDTADGTVAQAKKQARKQMLVEDRPLDDLNLYKKIGEDYYLRFKDRWIPSLSGEQLAALIGLHRTYLHEQHDFFPATQHPSASLALRRLASEQAMSSRMWKHGIHSFLENLRHQLPDCRELIWSFIYLSYSMMALLEEKVPQFRLTWVEYKADVARYR